MVNIKPSRIGGLREALRDLRLLRRARHRRLRRRPVRARPGTRAGAVPGLAVPPRHAERPRAGGYNQNDPPAGLPASPLPPAPVGDRLPLGRRRDGRRARRHRRARHRRLERDRRGDRARAGRPRRRSGAGGPADGPPGGAGARGSATPAAGAGRIEADVTDQDQAAPPSSGPWPSSAASTSSSTTPADAARPGRSTPPLDEWQRMVDVNVDGAPVLRARRAPPPAARRPGQPARGRRHGQRQLGRRTLRPAAAAACTTSPSTASARSASRCARRSTARHVRVSLVEPGAVSHRARSHNRPEIQAHAVEERFADVTTMSAHRHRRRDPATSSPARGTWRSTRY